MARWRPSELDDRMTAFYDGKYDVLLSTTIVESGLDIPSANTMIIHRADMFRPGPALPAARAGSGRPKTARLCLSHHRAAQALTPRREKRLKVLATLDTLGAGFQLASHDLDIRGAGNLLGRRAVGPYPRGRLRALPVDAGGGDLQAAGRRSRWRETATSSPQITLGVPVLIPEDYVPDLDVRLALYRRLSNLEEKARSRASRRS